MLSRPKQRLRQAADHFGGIVLIEEKRADRVLSHRTHAVAEHEPAGIGLDRRSTVANLHHLP
jgi:hypothetical protein